MPNIISQYLENCEALLERHGVSDKSNEGYAKYLEKLRILNEKVNSFYQLDPETGGEYPYLPMTGENVAELRKLYADAFTASDQYRKFLKESGEINNEMSVARLDLMDQISSVISRDYTALADTAAVTGKTLPEVIDSARGYQIDVTGQQLGTVGANMSQRIPVRFTDKNGTEKKGFFTPATKYEGREEKKRYTDELFDQYDKKDEKIIQALLESLVTKKIDPSNPGMLDSAKIRKFLDENIGENKVPPCELFNQSLRDLVKDNKATEDEIEPFIKRVSEDEKFTTAITTYLFNEAKYQNKVIMHTAAGINTGSRIDQRNAAMSAVADLLGRPTLLARSVKMEVKNGNEVTHGVFMEFAQGSDMNHLKDDDPLTKCDEKSGKNFNNPKAFKDIADLQVIDYICGNIDRHHGNMFYQFEETEDGPRLTGVVGIDNDLSFGTIESNSTVNRMVGPKDMLVISESMANRVSSMTKDMLALTLKNHNLSEAEIGAAWKRATNLQKTIQTGVEYFKDHPDQKIAARKLRIVPDDKWAEYSLKELSGDIRFGKGKNDFETNCTYFSELYKVPSDAIKEKETDKAWEQWRKTYLPELMKQSSSNVAEGKLLDLQENNARPLQADGNYRQMVETVKAAREKITLLTTPDIHGAVPKLSEKDIAELKEAFLTISDKASEYIGNPPEKPDDIWRIKQGYYEQIRKSAMRDYRGLDNAKSGQTLDEILSKAGARVVDITGKNLGTASENPLQSMKLTLTGEDGASVKGVFMQRKQAGDTTDAPIDTRNVAMSRMADLCGCGDLLAKAVPMRLLDNGREIEGTFVYNVQGPNAVQVSRDDPVWRVGRYALDNSPVLRQLADLAIMDFICGNKRDSDGIRYQVETDKENKSKITGIVGVNNAMSFGSATESETQNALNGLTCISASMAEHIRRMEPDTLCMAMDGTGLKQENLDAATKRLNMLKEKLTQDKIAVIPDEAFTEYRLENLEPRIGYSNIFSLVETDLNYFATFRDGINAGKPEENEAEQEEDVLDLTAVVDRNSLAQDAALLREISDDLALAEKWVFGGSTQYKNVRECTGELLNFMERYKDPNYVATERDEKAVLGAYAKTEELCELYLQRKREDGQINVEPDTKTGKRIAAVRKLLTFCQNRTEVLKDKEVENIQDEMFRNMQPAGVGDYIKNLNKMAQEKDNTPQTLSQIGSQISAAMLYAQKNHLTAKQLNFKETDIKAAMQNVENGRKANVTLSAQNEKKQAAPDKMAQKKEAPKIMQKPVIANL